MTFLRTTLTLYIVSFLIVSPVYAASKKNIAVIEVYDRKPTKNLAQLRHQLEQHLDDAKNVKIVSGKKIASYLNNLTADKRDMTRGDALYYEAEKLYLNYQLKKALKQIDVAINRLKRRPGILGNLYHGYLLKSQIQRELGLSKPATASVKQAIRYNASAKQPDSYLYPPRVRRHYRKALKQYKAKNKLVKLDITTQGKNPIYVNGVEKGTGPRLVLAVPQNKLQIITAGSSLSARSVKVVAKKKINKVRVRAKNRSAKASQAASALRLKRVDFKSMVKDASWMGYEVDADQVVLLGLNEAGYVNRMSVQIVDVRRQSVSRAKQIDLVSVNKDSKRAAEVAAKYIATLPKTSFKKSQINNLPVLIGKKRSGGGSKAVLWGLLGTVAIGAGVGAAMAMGGSSGGGDPPADGGTDVDVSISGL